MCVCVYIYIYIFMSVYLSIRSPGEGNGNPLQYSCLKNPMDSGAWGNEGGGGGYSPLGYKEWDTNACISELPCCTPETNTTL